jgi:hypothetical protein
MNETEKATLRKYLVELGKFTETQGRYHAFRRYSRPFLLRWLERVCREFGVEVSEW